jgi:ribosomal protein L28
VSVSLQAQAFVVDENNLEMVMQVSAQGCRAIERVSSKLYKYC